MNNLKTELVVIGGGAAGLFASAHAASLGIKCVLLEPNKRLGHKLRITGKGRCNLTNNCDVKTFLENVPVNPRFLYSAVSRFDSAAAMEYFEQLGVALKTERGARVFPQSDRAHDIADALIRCGKKNGVRLISEAARDLICEDGKITAVSTDSSIISCDAAILCTGGISYPLTGSTGDGYAMARKLGHTIVTPKPSLIPLVSPDEFCVEMQGLSLKNVVLSVFDDSGKRIFEELGEMLFTHFGVSGPLVLSASAHMRELGTRDYRLSIDLKPGLDEKKLDARILRDFEKYANRDFQNALGELAARAMIPILISLSGIAPETKVNSVTKQERQRLVTLFKDFSVRISGACPIEEAIITSGGVSVKEVNPKTMESKLISGLFFAGEVLDVDAYTGGFNLQIAWSTAYCAANSLCAEERKQ